MQQHINPQPTPERRRWPRIGRTWRSVVTANANPAEQTVRIQTPHGDLVMRTNPTATAFEMGTAAYRSEHAATREFVSTLVQWLTHGPRRTP